MAQEKAALMTLIGYNQIGNLLFYPINPIDAPIGRGVLCLSPFTERAWSAKELEQLSIIAPKVDEILDEAAEIEQKATSAQRLQALVNRVQRDRAQTVDQFMQSQALLAQLQEELQTSGQTHESEVELWLTRQDTLEDQLEDLQNTLRQNEATVAQAEALRVEKEQLERSMAQNALQVEGLRTALDQARNMLEGMSPQFANPEAKEPTASFVDSLQLLIDDLKLESDQKQIRVSVENSLSAEPNPVNKAQLLQICRSLLKNALAVSKTGSEVLLEVIPSGDHPGYVELRVSDAGPGLKPEDQTAFLKQISSISEPAEQNWGEVGALKDAVELTQSLGGHWWIHSVPNTITIHRLAFILLHPPRKSPDPYAPEKTSIHHTRGLIRYNPGFCRGHFCGRLRGRNGQFRHFPLPGQLQGLPDHSYPIPAQFLRKHPRRRHDRAYSPTYAHANACTNHPGWRTA